MNNDYFKIHLLRTNLEHCENSEDINKYQYNILIKYVNFIIKNMV